MRQTYLITFFILTLSFSAKGQFGNQIVDFSTSIRVEKNKIIEERWLEIQINDQESSWATDVEIAHGEGDKFKLLEAVILDSSGKEVRKLKKKEIQTRNKNSDGAFYEDNVLEYFSLKWNQYPYRIRYGYQKTSNKYLFVARWFPVVHTRLATKRARLQVEVPNGVEVEVDFSKAFDYKRNTNEEVTVYEWKIQDLGPLESKAFSPPWLETVPSVWVVPKYFKYGEEGS